MAKTLFNRDAAQAAAPESKPSVAVEPVKEQLPAELARDVARWVEYGASPRASINLHRCARISALLDGRSYVLPEDIKASAPDVLRHRVVLSYEAEAEGVGADTVIARVLSALTLP